MFDKVRIKKKYCQVREFPPVEKLNCDPYSTGYTDVIFQALGLDGLEYSTVDADIMKRFKELICQYPTAFFSRVVHSELSVDSSIGLTLEMLLPSRATHTRKVQRNSEQSRQKSRGCLSLR